MIWSVIPSLAVWPTICFLPIHDGTATSTQIMILWVVLYADAAFCHASLLPMWYLKRIRFPLTFFATIALMMTSIALSDKVKQQKQKEQLQLTEELSKTKQELEQLKSKTN